MKFRGAIRHGLEKGPGYRHNPKLEFRFTKGTESTSRVVLNPAPIPLFEQARVRG